MYVIVHEFFKMLRLSTYLANCGRISLRMKALRNKLLKFTLTFSFITSFNLFEPHLQEVA